MNLRGLAAAVAALLCASAAAGALAANGARSGTREADRARGPERGAVGAPPHRIVSTNLPADEVLLALVDPHRIVALSRFADDRAVSNVWRAARAVQDRVLGAAEPIMALRPDLVLAFPFGQGATLTLLHDCGVRVARVPGASDVQQVAHNIRLIGAAVGAAERARRLVAAMQRTLAEVRARVKGAPRPRVLLWYAGGFTSGAGTLIGDLLGIAGGRNAAAEAGVQGVQALPLERALALDPDAIFVLDYHADARARRLGGSPRLGRDPRWRSLGAVRRGRVYVLPAAHAYASSQYAALAAVDMARLLHPDRMANMKAAVSAEQLDGH